MPQSTPSSSFLKEKPTGTTSSSSMVDRRGHTNKTQTHLDDSNTRYLNDYSKTNEGLQEIDSKLKSLQLLLKNNVI